MYAMLNLSLIVLLFSVVFVSENPAMVEPSLPKGLKVLAVDDDKAFLLMLEKMLLACMYRQVTTCERGEEALSKIRGDRSRFDLILCDLYMPNMDGFDLLRSIVSETDVPVVMMSHEGTEGDVVKSVIYGACDFLVKPINIEQIGVLWHHVLRRKHRQHGWVNRELTQSDNVEEKREEAEEEEDEEHGTKAKKPRIIWTQELHHKFIQAVNQLGADKAVPKKIIECMQHMGVTELTRENVASHLQKFRLYVRRKSRDSMEHSGNSFNGLGLEQSSSGFQARKFLDPMMTSFPSGNVNMGNCNVAPRHVLMFPQPNDLTNTTAHHHHQHNTYSIDDGIDHTFVHNWNLYPPLIKHEGFGAHSSDPQLHIYACDQHNPSSFTQPLP